MRRVGGILMGMCQCGDWRDGITVPIMNLLFVPSLALLKSSTSLVFFGVIQRFLRRFCKILEVVGRCDALPLILSLRAF